MMKVRICLLKEKCNTSRNIAYLKTAMIINKDPMSDDHCDTKLNSCSLESLGKRR